MKAKFLLRPRNDLYSAALLNESVGAGHIDRHWPPAFKDSGAWPLAGGDGLHDDGLCGISNINIGREIAALRRYNAPVRDLTG